MPCLQQFETAMKGLFDYLSSTAQKLIELSARPQAFGRGREVRPRDYRQTAPGGMCKSGWQYHAALQARTSQLLRFGQLT